MHTGAEDNALIEFHPYDTNAEDLRANLVVTMSNGQITAMQDFRRRKKARRAAGVAATG